MQLASDNYQQFEDRAKCLHFASAKNRVLATDSTLEHASSSGLRKSQGIIRVRALPFIEAGRFATIVPLISQGVRPGEQHSSPYDRRYSVDNVSETRRLHAGSAYLLAPNGLVVVAGNVIAIRVAQWLGGLSIRPLDLHLSIQLQKRRK
jgi:hypothetical protein